MIKEILLKTSRLSNDYHSIPIIGTIGTRLGSKVDDEIVLKWPNLSLKYYVDEVIVLEGLDLPLKSNFPEVMTTTPSAVSPSSSLTKVLEETFVKSTTRIQALVQGVRMYKFEIV